MNVEQDWASMLAVAVREARTGLAEGGLPIGAAMFNSQGQLLQLRAQSTGTARRSVGARGDRCFFAERGGCVRTGMSSW